MGMTPDDLATGPITSEDLRARMEVPNRLVEMWLSQIVWTSTATYRAAENAFRAGFAAGLAHAPTAPDPATVAAMRELLKRIHDAFGVVIKRADKNASQTIRFERLESTYLQKDIAALLGGGADGTE